MVFTSTGIIFALDEVEEAKEIKEPAIEKIEEKKIEEVKVDEPQNDKIIEEPKVEEPKVEEPQEIKAEEVKKEEVKKEEVKTEEVKEKEEPPKKDPEPEEPVVEITTPVEKVIVKLYARNGSGNYAIAQTWNAVANGRGFEVLDRINLYVSGNPAVEKIVKKFEDTIKHDTLANSIIYNEKRENEEELSINGEKTTFDVEVIK